MNLDPVLGLELNRALLRTIDRGRYPMFDYCARAGIVSGLYRSGRGAMAIRWSRTIETHEITASSYHFARKFLWTKAQILASLGRVDEAIRLTEALLREHDAEEDAIVATALLDLAEFALARGRVGKAHRLALESSALFSSMGAERYARMAAQVTTRH